MSNTASLFSQRPLPDWIHDLQHAEAAEDRYRALMAVNSLADPADAISWCRFALRDLDSTVQALAAKQLGDLKRNAPQAVDEPIWLKVTSELEASLPNADLDVRFEGARALGRIDPTHAGAKATLLSLLDDDQTQPLMLAIVVSAFSEMSESDLESMAARFQKLIGHDQAEVRENVSATIVKWGTLADRLIPELIVALDDDEPIVRENAAIALGHTTGSRAEVVPALRAAESDEDEGVAVMARNARAKLSRG